MIVQRIEIPEAVELGCRQSGYQYFPHLDKYSTHLNNREVSEECDNYHIFAVLLSYRLFAR